MQRSDAFQTKSCVAHILHLGQLPRICPFAPSPLHLGRLFALFFFFLHSVYHPGLKPKVEDSKVVSYQWGDCKTA